MTKTVGFIMLNPSTADANVDDPTIRRCINFSKSWGYNRLLVGNLYAYRSPHPRDLLSVNYPKLHNSNIDYLRKLFVEAEVVVCAWGNEATIKSIDKKNPGRPSIDLIFLLSKELAKPLYYIELTKKGTPKHPLYLKKDLKPKQWNFSE
ncbi:MAG: DUF1643 domain-containing protein [Bacteroidota bacterium]